jgi:drug/metabolite transporter (DMT)-like permease
LLILISAYRRAPAALVAPFQYSQMVWAILLGFVIWGDLPDPAKLLGAAIVATSGLFIVYRETALGRRPTASLHPSAGARPRSG